MGRFVAIFFLAQLLVHYMAPPAHGQDQYIITRIEGPIQLDGFSDEPVWQTVEPLPLLQQSPDFGSPPSERTEIRIAYDDRFLYVSGRLYDDPEGIIGPTLKRDVLGPNNDYLALILDTFNDNENALAFFTTPTGIRLDFAIFNDAQPTSPNAPPWNTSWDTFWDVAVTRSDDGWFAEMRIPFSSLRFQDRDGRVVMGLTAWRWIARKGEIDIFPAYEASWAAWSPFKPSQSREIAFEGIYSRRPVYLTPYLLGGTAYTNELNDAETAYDHIRSSSREIGLDLKYGLTSNLTLDVTLNTDFAQVEADDQQVNLTRFSLFFPEKRRFFQERASIFNVPVGESNSLFYSRRIGLYEEQQIPILGGLRLVGRIGKWDVGAINMQTAKDEEADNGEELPSENFGVLRLRRQVFNPRSYLGGIVTSRRGRDGSYNTLYGIDGIFNVFGEDYLTLTWAQSFEDGKENDYASPDPARLYFNWVRRDQDGFFYNLSLSRAGVDYNPGIGFEMRENFTSFRHQLGYGWIASADSPLNRHNLSLNGFACLRNSDREVESAEFGPAWYGFYNSYASLDIAFKTYYEDLIEPFELTEDIEVPTGSYTFYGAEVIYRKGGGRMLDSGLTLTAGTFYDGTRLSLGLLPRWSLSPQLNLDGYYQINWITFPDRDEEFTAHIGRLRVELTLTTALSAFAFVQYNSKIDMVSANVRLRYNPREGNDLYLVYNEGFNTDRYREDPALPLPSNGTIILKYAYTFIL